MKKMGTLLAVIILSGSISIGGILFFLAAISLNKAHFITLLQQI